MNCTVPVGRLLPSPEVADTVTLRFRAWPTTTLLAEALRADDVVASGAVTVCVRTAEVLGALLASPE